MRTSGAGIALVLFVVVLPAAPAFAGIKVGYFVPQSSDYDAGVSYALEGRFRVVDQLELGFELTHQPKLGGAVGYTPTSRLGGGSYSTTGLTFVSITANGWWYFTDHLYGGLGIGSYRTGEDIGGWYSPDDNVATPGGTIVQGSVGFMQKPGDSEHLLLFGELSYRYCSGSGTLGTRTRGYHEVSGPSGLAVSVGLTF